MADLLFILNFNETMRFINKLFIFLIIVFIVDRFLGFQLDYFFNNKIQGGNFGIINQAIKNKADIIILGASRAHHNYIPEIISKNTKLSCYNLGLDGMSIIYNYCLLTHILNNYKPKLVIYDVGGFELSNKWAGPAHYDKLMPIIRKYDNLIELIKINDPYIKLKLILSLYSYNQKIHSLINDGFILNKITFSGYAPLFGSEPEKVFNDNPDEIPLHDEEDNTHWKALHYFINKLKEDNIPFVFIFSPTWPDLQHTIQPNLLKTIRSNSVDLHIIHKKYYSEFLNRNLYKDPAHLNQEGAVIFSKIVNLKIKTLLEKSYAP
jgi:hypothetical protein